MAVPKKKTSKSKRDKRRSHHRFKIPNVVTCAQCQESVLPHRVCPECGTYRGRSIIKTEET